VCYSLHTAIKHGGGEKGLWDVLHVLLGHNVVSGLHALKSKEL